MDWSEARDRTLDMWRSIREQVEGDEVELLRRINSVSALCEKAQELAGRDGDWCRQCLFYEQFGGCMGITIRMSECVVDGKRIELRQLVDDTIGQLERLTIPSPVD